MSGTEAALRAEIAYLEARLAAQQEMLEAEARRRIELEEELAALKAARQTGKD